MKNDLPAEVSAELREDISARVRELKAMEESLALRDDALRYEIENAVGDPTRYWPYYVSCGCSVRAECKQHAEMSEALQETQESSRQVS